MMPTLLTERLIVRPLCMDNLQDIHRILDAELAEVNGATTKPNCPTRNDARYGSRTQATMRALPRIAATNEALASLYPRRLEPKRAASSLFIWRYNIASSSCARIY